MEIPVLLKTAEKWGWYTPLTAKFILTVTWVMSWRVQKNASANEMELGREVSQCAEVGRLTASIARKWRYERRNCLFNV